MRGARRQRGPAAAPARRLPGRPRCHASPTGNVPQRVRDRILDRRPGPDRRHHGRDRRRGCPVHRRRPRPLPAPGRRLRPLPVKENRAVLFDQLDTLDWDETTNAAITVHRTEETDSGRHEIRVVRVQPLVPGQVNFPHATRALLVERYTTGRGDGKIHADAELGITAAPSDVADSAAFACCVRGQWSIEAQHFVRDVTFSGPGAARWTAGGLNPPASADCAGDGRAGVQCCCLVQQCCFPGEGWCAELGA